MSELLMLQGHEKVLEIGTGSGYQAAVLSLLAEEVYTVERVAVLAEQAREALAHLGYTNVHVHVGDGSLGWPEHAPYDRIIVTCAGPKVPSPLLDQLADRGRLVMPVGPRGFQDLVLVRRQGDQITYEKQAPVAFVPLIGEHGW
jgi:protein-L-isoaspartate(D-aspartate) O-methyltransferase